MLSVQKDATWQVTNDGWSLISEKFGLLATIHDGGATGGGYSAIVIPNRKYHIFSTSLQDIKDRVSKFLLNRDRITKFLDNQDGSERRKPGLTYEEERGIERKAKAVRDFRRGRKKFLSD